MLTINGVPLEKSFNFPGGEVHIKLPSKLDLSMNNTILVETRLEHSDAIMELILVKNALDHYYPDVKKFLKVAYFPYARQDRRCDVGEAYSLKVMVDIIDSMNFSKIIIADPHSITLTSLLKTKYRIIEAVDIIARQAQPVVPSPLTIVAPDEGARMRASKVADFYHAPIVVMAKQRDPSTGKINGISLEDINNARYIKDRNILIVDDICDGGRTFMGATSILRKYDPLTVSLYVTHGIFSMGLDLLYESGIDNIFTTNSFCGGLSTDRLTVWKV